MDEKLQKNIKEFEELFNVKYDTLLDNLKTAILGRKVLSIKKFEDFCFKNFPKYRKGDYKNIYAFIADIFCNDTNKRLKYLACIEDENKEEK